MRTSYILIGTLGLLLAACGQPFQGYNSGLRGGPAGPSTGAGVPTAGTGTIAPIQGQSDVGQGTVTRP